LAILSKKSTTLRIFYTPAKVVKPEFLSLTPKMLKTKKSRALIKSAKGIIRGFSFSSQEVF